MIKLVKVNKYFNRFKKNQIHVIQNTSLEFENTGLVAILGNSGSGKTTLLNAIGGLDKVNKGKIYINGKKITKRFSGRVDKVRNLNIGYIFQNYNLINDMTVFDNVALALKMCGVKNKEEIKKRVNYILEVLGIYKFRNRYANMMSGGERQRVAIARALVKNPNIIIADEPTGNLDSKNSLEIMNIIKSISKNKLVILVTHERQLAEFYASRIIEVVDGKVVNDRVNEHTDDLDYRLDNKIYLKEFKEQKDLSKDNINVKFYSDSPSDEEIKVKLVLKNGNIYIEAENHKIEVVDDTSSMELVDDYYKKISKEEYEKYQFKYEEIIDKKYKMRYASIYNPITLIIDGFKKVFNYSILKKLLLLGFVVSSMFILYAVSNIMGVTDIKDEKFITKNKEYLNLVIDKINIDDYLAYENLEHIDYMIPGTSLLPFNIKYDDYYQTQNSIDEFSASIASKDIITEDNLIYGRMPEAKNEVVVDKMVLRELISSAGYYQAPMVGIKNVSEFLNRKLTPGTRSYDYGNTASIKLEDFVIVGISDLVSPCIYMSNDNFINLLANVGEAGGSGGNGMFMYAPDTMGFGGSNSNAGGLSKNIYDVNLAGDRIELSKGRMPQNDYEIIVNASNSYEMKLNKTIDDMINGNKLKVVGYYTSKENINDFFTTENTIKYKLLSEKSNITIYSNNKEETLNYFQNLGMNIENTYEKDKNNYTMQIKDSIRSSIVVAAIILAISLIEIFLMMRSSFLSRVKEVGILRAIGVKKKDIYKMFLGEIIALTTLTAVPGLFVMSYILKGLQLVPYYQDQFMYNGTVLGISIAIIVGFNILVGLLPVHNVIRKTPAKILSGNSVN